MGIRKQHPITGEAIHIGRGILHGGMTHTAHLSPIHALGVNKNDVRLRRHFVSYFRCNQLNIHHTPCLSRFVHGKNNAQCLQSVFAVQVGIRVIGIGTIAFNPLDKVIARIAVFG